MKYIGIDIGIVNFALSVVDINNNNSWHISWMNILDTSIKRYDNPIDIYNKVTSLLSTHIGDIVPDKVIIESQPGRRLVMERIVMAVIGYFRGAVDIKLIRSPMKYKIDKSIIGYPKGKKNYSNRKQMAIDLGQKCLSDERNEYIETNKTRLQWINDNFKKKDDLYDAFLLPLYDYGYTI